MASKHKKRFLLFYSVVLTSFFKKNNRFEYLWADGKKYKKATRLTAPEYIDNLMAWVQDYLDDETLFPSKMGVPFPKTFTPTVKQIFKRLFRVYAHIYYTHFDKVLALTEEAHLNSSFMRL